MPPDLPRIRLATRADATTLSELRIELFRELGHEAPGAEAAFVAVCRAKYEELFDADRVVAWLAETSEGAPAAALTMLAFDRLPSPVRLATLEGYVLGVYTVPAWRGRGLATALMQLALADASRRGFARIRLHASDKGRGVYEALAFRGRSDEMELTL